MRWRGTVRALLLGLGVLLAGRGARAEHVLIATVRPEDGGWPEAEAQARAELSSIDLSPQLTNRPTLRACANDADTRQAIEQQAALAALELRWMNAAQTTLRICVVDLVTGKATARYFDRAPLPDAAQAALLGVELVHASLIEVMANHPSRGSVQAPSTLQRRVNQQLAPRGGGRVELRAGAGAVLTGPGVLDLALSAGAAISLRRPISLDLGLELPLVSSSVTGSEGRASIQPTLFHAALALTPLARGNFASHVMAGGGALLARVKGTANVPYVDAAEVATTWLLIAGLGARWRLSDALGIRMDGMCGYAPTPLEIGFAGRTAITLGRPLASATLALQYTL